MKSLSPFCRVFRFNYQVPCNSFPQEPAMVLVGFRGKEPINHQIILPSAHFALSPVTEGLYLFSLHRENFECIFLWEGNTLLWLIFSLHASDLIHSCLEKVGGEFREQGFLGLTWGGVGMSKRKE